MTRAAFDEVIHAPNRLQICAMLATVSVSFSTIREALGVSESVLSKQVKILQTAGYVSVTKTRGGAYVRVPADVPRNSRTQTWLALTPNGRKALAGHLAELNRIASMATNGTGEDS